MKACVDIVFRQILTSKIQHFFSVVQNILSHFNLGFIALAGHLSSILKRVGALITCVAPQKNWCPVYVRSTAFTMVEVLIVVAIIGVIAAMVLPNISSSMEERANVAKLKKTYAALNEAHKRAKAVYGPVGTWFTNDTSSTKAYSTRYAERIIEFMSVAKNCKFTSQGCFTNDGPTRFDGTISSSINTNADYYKFISADGASVAFSVNYNFVPCINDSPDIANSPSGCYYGAAYIDVDGPNKGANSWGVDIFILGITEQEIHPSGSPNDRHGVGTMINSGCFANRVICTGWVIETGNMEYLKTTNKGKCSNGKQLSWTITSCK